MHVFTDSKVALRDAVTRQSKRLSSWELLKPGRERQSIKGRIGIDSGQKEQTDQQEKAYER
jgi:hypothetical protein